MAAESSTCEARVKYRQARRGDAAGLAAVMAARGGRPADWLEQATRLLETLPVLIVAEGNCRLVGWTGVQEFEIWPGKPKEWLVAGLTVVPDMRRRGIAKRLLEDAVNEVVTLDPGRTVFSVVNANNGPSVSLHEQIGFAEVERGPAFAQIEFDGGVGLLLRRFHECR